MKLKLGAELTFSKSKMNIEINQNKFSLFMLPCATHGYVYLVFHMKFLWFSQEFAMQFSACFRIRDIITVTRMINHPCALCMCWKLGS